MLCKDLMKSCESCSVAKEQNYMKKKKTKTNIPRPFLCFEPPILAFLMLHRFQGESITNFKERVKKKIDIQEKEFEKVSQSYFQGLCVSNR